MECRYDDELGNYVIVSETIYTTEELMQMAEEALGSFELTDDQKAAYGLLDDE